MPTKEDLVPRLREALQSLGGKGTVVDISRAVWKKHEQDLRESGDLFFTWHYDLRWAAFEMRREGELRGADESPRGIWELA